MVKFPSQNKLWYQTGTIGTGLTAITSGGTSGVLNLPKDLSMLNRRGYASTDKRGVPWIFRCKIDYYIQDEDQNGVSAAVGTDFASTLDAYGCQNNWVVRNAAVKFHAARDAMWRKSGVKKSDLGAYAGAIRYNYDTNGNSWLTPIDGDGNAFTGGTWDTSELITESDSSGFYLKLVGAGIDETAGNTATAINIAHSYLASRAYVSADTNLESSESPTKFSVLNELLRPVSTSGIDDNVIEDAQDQGDNPPYEIDIDQVNSDITEPVLLGRALASLGNGYGSMIVDIPFGLADMKASVHDAAGTSVTSAGSICVEVLSIYPMQG